MNWHVLFIGIVCLVCSFISVLYVYSPAAVINQFFALPSVDVHASPEVSFLAPFPRVTFAIAD